MVAHERQALLRIAKVLQQLRRRLDKVPFDAKSGKLLDLRSAADLVHDMAKFVEKRLDITKLDAAISREVASDAHHVMLARVIGQLTARHELEGGRVCVLAVARMQIEVEIAELLPRLLVLNFVQTNLQS
jgi:hypothetical protein